LFLVWTWKSWQCFAKRLISIEIVKKKKMSKKNYEAFDKMMGYAMETVNELAEKAKEINRNSIIALNNRDLKENGIEQD